MFGEAQVGFGWSPFPSVNVAHVKGIRFRGFRIAFIGNQEDLNIIAFCTARVYLFPAVANIDDFNQVGVLCGEFSGTGVDFGDRAVARIARNTTDLVG